MRRRGIAVSFLAATVGVAFAADPASIEFFGYRYKVQKLDLTTSVTFTDPLFLQTIGLIECEGTHWLGNNKLLFSSNEMDQWGSYANFVVEADLVTDGSDNVTGIQFSRIVVTNDENLTPPPGDFDLDPGGVTINTGATGLGAGGQVIVADTNDERLRAYDFVTGQLLPANIDLKPANDDLEDALYLNGKFYTIHEDQTATAPFLSIEVFTASGVHLPLESFKIASDANPAAIGSPKGLTFVPESSRMPPELQGHGGLLMVTMDDGGPGIQFFDLQGAEIAFLPLTSDGTSSGVPLLDAGGQVLQIESVAFDPISGRFFLTQQGLGTGNNFLWVLTPLEENYGNACYGSGGFTPKLDAVGEFSTGSSFTWSLTGGLGGAQSIVMIGLSKDSLPITPGCTLNLSPILTFFPLTLGGVGPGQGSISVTATVGTFPSGSSFTLQGFVVDPGVPPRGFSSTQGQYLASP